MWVKYSMPRIRIDHMLAFNWKFLTPLSLGCVIITAIMDKVLAGAGLAGYALGMLAANLLFGILVLSFLRTYAQKERQRVAEPRPYARPEHANTPHSVKQPPATTPAP
jgi:hypothetical protein